MPARAIAVRPDVGLDRLYPFADGEPSSESVERYEFITTIQSNLDHLLRDAFVGADQLIYPVRGRPDIRRAPDVFVVFGAGKAKRKSWLPWNEGDRLPDVVFEGCSLGPTIPDLWAKHEFYDRYGARELILWDLIGHKLMVWVRQGEQLVPVDVTGGWTSPSLGCSFEVEDGELVVRGPDGERFRPMQENLARLDALAAERDAAQAERDAAQAERDAAQAERDAAMARAEALAARLRALGVDP